jgi:hypothetical protein
MHLATHVRSRASRESNPILKAEWENLAETYIRLAVLHDEWDTDLLTIQFRICWIALGIDRYDALDQVAKSTDRQLAADGP